MPQLKQYRRTTSPVRSLQSEVNRLFEDIFPWRSDTEEPSEAMMWSPAVDVAETDNAYHLRVDLPGVRREDVTINADENRLMISGKRHRQETKEGQDFLRVERSSGSFYRSLSLPAGINADKSNATFENGVLTVEIPKLKASKSKQIKIR